jgi:hypothetical protein
MSKVSVSIGKTVNLGNFESIRLDVMVELDVPEMQTVQAVLDEAQALADDHLTNQLAQVQ